MANGVNGGQNNLALFFQKTSNQNSTVSKAGTSPSNVNGQVQNNPFAAKTEAAEDKSMYQLEASSVDAAQFEFDFGVEDKKVNTQKVQAPNTQPITKNEILLPRFEMTDRHGNPITDVAQFGFKKLPDGTYKAHNGKVFTHEKINNYFRKLEQEFGYKAS